MDPIPLEQLHWECPQEIFSFNHTDEIEPPNEIIGQASALESIKIGTEISSPGYNIFITGLVGTGRKTMVYKYLRSLISSFPPELEDILYFYNFDTPDEPLAFKVKAGQGKALMIALNDFAENIEDFISTNFRANVYFENLLVLEQQQKQEETDIFNNLNDTVNQYGFEWSQSSQDPAKLILVPLVEGKPIDFNELSNLASEGKITTDQLNEIKEKKDKLEKVITSSLNEVRIMKNKHQEQQEQLDRKIAEPLTNLIFEDLKKITDSDQIQVALDRIKNFILDNIPKWKLLTQDINNKQLWQDLKPVIINKLKTNLAVDNSTKKEAPIIIENSPTESNLFGTVELSEQGDKNHLNVKPGSFLKAHRGFLLIDAYELLQSNETWQRFKRTLKTGRLEISPIATPYSVRGYLRPHPIKIEVKVILIGKEEIYSALFMKDPEFSKIFKIKANFVNHMPLTNDNLLKYAEFTSLISKRDKLLPFDPSSIVAICEYGYRLAGGQQRISTEFGKISDLIKQSNYWQKQIDPQAKIVTTQAVKLALEKKRERHTHLEREIHKLIQDEIIKLNLSGKKIGQVNGLTILEDEETLMGFPVRITASTSPGKKGVISIDRESELSGEIHTKGIMIINGFLRQKYAKNFPLSLQASICFEQTYNLIDGDSATCAEICALLSSITQIPIYQNFAITGSADQYGNVQAVGGINEKIEGFYYICKMKNINDGSVIIPRDNLQNLQLNDQVLEEVKNHKFKIFPVSKIDQIIELISGCQAGEIDYQPEGLINFNREVMQSLKKMSEIVYPPEKEF
ncbi:MAG: Lon protease family protein [bacterium]